MNDFIAARKLEENVEEIEVETTTMITDEHDLMKRSLEEDKMVFTRSGAYRLIENRLNILGIDGKKCLLLAICEAAKYPFMESNGVIGHVFHIILT